MDGRPIAAFDRALPGPAGRRVAAKQYGRRRRGASIERDKERRETGRLALKLASKGPDRPLRRVEITRLREPVTERRQGLCCDSIPRRRRIVVTGLGPVYERFVIVAGEKKPAAGWILESREQRIRELGGPSEIAC